MPEETEWIDDEYWELQPENWEEDTEDYFVGEVEGEEEEDQHIVPDSGQHSSIYPPYPKKIRPPQPRPVPVPKRARRIKVPAPNYAGA